MGAIVTDIRGKLGGHVFQKGFQSRVMKTNSKPSKNNTRSQRITQTIVNNVVALYTQLSFAHKVAWQNSNIVFTKKNRFGDNINYTGRQLFLFLNNNLAKSWLTSVLTPTSLQTVVTRGNCTSVVINIGGGYIEVRGSTAISETRYIVKVLNLRNIPLVLDKDKFVYLESTAVLFENSLALFNVPPVSR